MARTQRDPKWKEILHQKLHEDNIPHVHDFFDDPPVLDELEDFGRLFWEIKLKDIWLN